MKQIKLAELGLHKKLCVGVILVYSLNNQKSYANLKVVPFGFEDVVVWYNSCWLLEMGRRNFFCSEKLEHQ